MSKRLNSFGEELGRFLNYYNISNNEFAERIGTTPKNLIDIIDGKVSLSFNMICNISFVSEIPVDYISNVEESFKIDNNIYDYLKDNKITLRQFINKYNYKELRDKYNVNFRDIRDDNTIAEDIMKYLRIIDPKTINKDNNCIFYKSKNDKPELLALWLEHCYRTIKNQELGIYKKENIDILVNFIKKEANNYMFNKERLIKKFNKYGIFLAIEPDLKGAKIRGAFRVLNNKPAIYITPKYNRYGDIYFALLHELAHCKSDFNRAKKGSIISLDNSKSNEDYELKADKTAFNWIINDKEYQTIVETKKIKSCYAPCLVAYRLANDNIISYNSKIYQEYNRIIN